MNFSRLRALSNEVTVINAIINNEEGVTLDLLFPEEEEFEFKLNKLCEIAYNIFNSFKLENDDVLINLFNELQPGLGEFCVGFIKFNDERDKTLNEKIEELLKLDVSNIPTSNIKIDYLNMILSLLLCQKPLNMELINRFNEEIKSMIN